MNQRYQHPSNPIREQRGAGRDYERDYDQGRFDRGGEPPQARYRGAARPYRTESYQERYPGYAEMDSRQRRRWSEASASFDPRQADWDDQGGRFLRDADVWGDRHRAGAPDFGEYPEPYRPRLQPRYDRSEWDDGSRDSGYYGAFEDRYGDWGRTEREYGASSGGLGDYRASALGSTGYGSSAQFGAYAGEQSRSGSAQNFKGKGPKGYRRSDERLQEVICERLTEDPLIDASDVTVRCESGKVVLEGSVNSRYLKHRIEDLVDDCSGVQDIDNRLRVSPRRDHATASGISESVKSGSAGSGLGSSETARKKN